MASFEKFYPKLGIEGGYLSPTMAAKYKDNGGETYKGVSRVYNPLWAGWAIVDQWKAKMGSVPHNYKFPDPALDAMVKKLMKQNYWDALGLDSVKNQSLAEFMADFAVNSGAGTVAKQIQRFFKIVVDGEVGPVTISKINAQLNTKPLFDDLQAFRKRIIAGLDDPQKVKNALVERTDAFFFSRRNKIIIALPLLSLGVWLAYQYRQDIKKSIYKIIT